MQRRVIIINAFIFALLMFLTVPGTTSARPNRGKGDSPIDRFDRDRDGKLSKQEFRGPAKAFEDMDAANDGYLTGAEMRNFRKRSPGTERSKTENNISDKPYPSLNILTYDKSKTYPGNVIFLDKLCNRVVEADLNGKIVWECCAPKRQVEGRMRQSCGSSLTDVELLPNDNVLVLVGGAGVYELNRMGEVLWAYENKNVSHDVDRLKNGNTLMACVGAEKASDFPYKAPQAVEVSPEGEIVWAWYAKHEYADSRYKDVRSGDADDWTHMNSVQRLDDGNTLLSVCNRRQRWRRVPRNSRRRP